MTHHKVIILITFIAVAVFLLVAGIPKHVENKEQQENMSIDTQQEETSKNYNINQN